MSVASLINKQVKKQDLTSVLADGLMTAIKLQNPPRASTKKNIKPSKTKCQRQMYYILTGGEANKVSTTDPKLTLIQKVGTFLHSQTQEALAGASKQGILFRKPENVVLEAQAKGINTVVVESDHAKDNPYECNCYNQDWDISFMFDGAIQVLNTDLILEIKSEDHFKFIKRIAPDPDHISQATHYCLGLGYDKVIFLYIDRNYMTVKCYLVQIGEEQLEAVKENIRQVKHSVETKELPALTKCTACKYCDYTKICKSDINPLEEGA